MRPHGCRMGLRSYTKRNHGLKQCTYTSAGYSGMKGFVPVLFWNLHSRGERGKKREGVQISKQSTQNFSYQSISYRCAHGRKRYNVVFKWISLSDIVCLFSYRSFLFVCQSLMYPSLLLLRNEDTNPVEEALLSDNNLSGCNARESFLIGDLPPEHRASLNAYELPDRPISSKGSVMACEFAIAFSFPDHLL